MIQPAKIYEGFTLTFNTTEACNLACKYCYEVNKTPRDLPLEYAYRFIDMILDDPDPIGVVGTSDEWILQQGVILDFIGGDSLIKPDLLDKIIQYWMVQTTLRHHKWRSRWRVSISSNGTYLHRPDVQRFITKYRDVLSLGLSIDGCPELHDLNRVYPDGRGSLQDILKNWDWYLSVFGESGRRTKSTLAKNSIPYLYDSLVYLHETLGITDVSQNFIFEDMQLNDIDLKLLDEQLEKCVNYVFQHKDDLYWAMLDHRFDEASMFEPRSSCGSGLMPALSIEGYIYPCFRWLPHTQAHTDPKQLSAGSVFEGLIRKDRFHEVKSQTNAKISPPKCKSCGVESACSWCIGGSYSEFNDFVRQTYICEATKLQHKWSSIYWRKYEDSISSGN